MNSKDLIKLLEAKLKNAPTDLSVKEQLAGLFLTNANFQKASKLYKEILEINPENSKALWGMIKISWQTKEFKKAYSYLAKLEKIADFKFNKEQALVYTKVCVQIKDFSLAQKWFDYAASLDSSVLESEIGLLRFLRSQATIQEQQNDNDNDTPGGIRMDKKSNFILIEMPGQQGPIDPAQFLNQLQPDNLNINEVAENSIPAETVSSVITFDQIGGLKDVKRQLFKELLLPLSQNKNAAQYNLESNPKVLLYGPPGCGKTLLCHALFNESDLTFFTISPGDFADLSYEESEVRFEYLLAQARHHKPAILLIDDVSWLSHEAGSVIAEKGEYLFRKNLLNRFLKLLDKKFRFNSQIGLLAISNVPWHLSTDLLGSNRINKTIYIPPPTLKEKVDILNVVLESKASSILDPSSIDSVKVMNALNSYYHSGAELEILVNDTISEILLDSMLTKNQPQGVITTELLIRVGKANKNKYSAVTDWMKKSEQELKPKSSPMHYLWQDMESTVKNRYE